MHRESSVFHPHGGQKILGYAAKIFAVLCTSFIAK
jgi:hypothetical protein